jgi:hypothetical protein
MKPLKPEQEKDVAGGIYVEELVEVGHWPPFQIEPHDPAQPDALQPAELNPEPTVR